MHWCMSVYSGTHDLKVPFQLNVGKNFEMLAISRSTTRPSSSHAALVETVEYRK